MANSTEIAAFEDKIIDAGIAAKDALQKLQEERRLSGGSIAPGVRDNWGTLCVNIRVTIDRLLDLRSRLKPELEATGPYSEGEEPRALMAPTSKYRATLTRRLEHLETEYNTQRCSPGSVQYLRAEINALRFVLGKPIALFSVGDET